MALRRCPECEGLMCVVMGKDYNDYYKCNCGYSKPLPAFDPYDSSY